LDKYARILETQVEEKTSELEQKNIAFRRRKEQ
jgi:nitrate/nitrite-specific signal transduction histidine kinase